ncbi:MAG: helix-turn-helix domain-containing protein [Lentisphaeria bacterium]|jgi:AraC-like DNA-binding protein
MQGAYGRGTLAGISQFLRARHSPWQVQREPSRVAAPIQDLATWDGDGVIAEAWQEGMRRQLSRLPRPVVNTSDHLPSPPFATSVLADSAKIGTLAARHLLERRFRASLDRSIGEQIGVARIARAKQVLVNCDAPTAEVAARAGFQYVQQFNAMFKRITGLTPVAYRRQFLTG